ncbi:hypothetical protein [Shewanella sp. Isolate11]|uniref:hypothetical protein n=1 Tax=Shewanella sp. Isolate11 TaxID=2908530 RepID=UPI001EFDBBB5|nr:hypothetical protein [Shewanella sp. Isolate11]MCG9695370.1 hypothetical protein [Shewanella sp. Isolate11]
MTIFAITNTPLDGFTPNLRITQQFLSDIAPRAMLICAFIGVIHYWVNQKLDYSFNKSKLNLNQKIFGLTFFLGCSNLLLFLKTERIKLSLRDRYMVLLISLSSAGGISCISISALGIPVYQILIASLALPLLIVILALPFNTGKSTPMMSGPEMDAESKSANKTLAGYIVKYLVGASKLIANKAITIMFFELIRNSINKFNIDWSHVVYYPHLLLNDLGFNAQAAEVITQAWIAKTVANREAALIDIANSGIYDELSLIHQMLTISLLINIASIGALIVIGLNILALFGKQGMQFLSILPIAFVIVNVVPILPVVLYALVMH